MNINELVIKNENELSIRQKDFLETHNNIMSAGAVISNGLLQLAVNLKKMKEEELYSEIGYSCFEDYTVKCCNLKLRQAYNYIKILDSFDANFLHSNAKIGVSKLTLLSSLSSDEIDEINTNTNLSEVTVKELKSQVEKLKSKNSDLNDKIKLLNNKDKETIIVEKDSKETLDKLLKLELEIKNKNSEIAEMKINYTDSNKIKDKLISEIDLLKKELSVNSNKELLEFKILFNNIQADISKLKELLLKLPEDKVQNCTNAINKLGELLCKN